MASVNIQGSTLSAMVTYPSDTCFAYNPIYVTLSNISGTAKSVGIRVASGGTDRTVPVPVLGSTVKVYISSIIQTFFTNIRSERCLEFQLYMVNVGDYEIGGFQCICGSVTADDCYNSIGYIRNIGGVPVFERYAVWFKNYPFSFSVYSQSAAINTVVRKDEEAIAGEFDIPVNAVRRRVSSVRNHMPDIEVDDVTANHSLTYYTEPDNSVSSFDDTYDRTFYPAGKLKTKVNIRISEEKDGVYLRWIDRFGELQYYLFVKGDKESKLTKSQYYIEEPVTNTTHEIGNTKRLLNIKTEPTLKCCAVSLPEEVYNYVETIMSSPVIDMYMGEGSMGDIWIPVNIASDSVIKAPRTVLRDIEITLELPVITTQTL